MPCLHVNLPRAFFNPVIQKIICDPYACAGIIPVIILRAVFYKNGIGVFLKIPVFLRLCKCPYLLILPVPAVLTHCLEHGAWAAGIFSSHIRLKHDHMRVHRIFFHIFPVAELTVFMINTNRRLLNPRRKVYYLFYCFFYFSHITVSSLKKSGKTPP